MRYMLTILSIFMGELFLKNHIEAKVPENSEKKALHDMVILTKHRNRGAVFNIGEKRPKIVLWISVVFTILAAALFLCSLGFAGKRLLKWGFTFLLGGAFSNTYDRLKRGYVVDYFRLNAPVKRIRSLIFNLSDFCIMLGAALIVAGESVSTQ